MPADRFLSSFPVPKLGVEKGNGCAVDGPTKGAVTSGAFVRLLRALPWLSVANAFGTLTETARKKWGDNLFLMFMFSAFVNHLSRIL